MPVPALLCPGAETNTGFFRPCDYMGHSHGDWAVTPGAGVLFHRAIRGNFSDEKGSCRGHPSGHVTGRIERTWWAQVLRRTSCHQKSRSSGLSIPRSAS